MGSHAERVAAELERALAERVPSADWTTERYVGRTPVDVAGEGGGDGEEDDTGQRDDTGDCDGDGDGDPGRLTLVELEWRRADPSDNAVKLFRHLDAGEIDGEVHVVQLFSRYYYLSTGGVDAKRRNAEFVGDLAEASFPEVTYHAPTLDVDPPKRGGELPDGWRDAVAAAADRIAERR